MRAKLEQILGKFDEFAYQHEHTIYWWASLFSGQIRFDLSLWGIAIVVTTMPKVILQLGPLEFIIFFEDYSKWKVIFR